MSADLMLVVAIGVTTLISIGGLGFVLTAGSSSKKTVSKRVAGLSTGGRVAGVAGRSSAATDVTKDRRKQVQATLKDLEEKAKEKKKRLTLRRLIEQSGLVLAEQTFYLFSALTGLIVIVIAVATGQSLLISGLAGFAAGLGLPRWLLFVLRGKRQQKFTLEFSSALDVITRGVKSGLPVNECLRIIATESPSPIREEFALLVEGQRIGLTLEQGLNRMYERMPLSEVNFFSIVLIIQQKTGGNLAEALSNLASVLRGRKMLKGKIESLTSEARASATILLILPFGIGSVMALSGDYMEPMFSTPLGHMLLMGAGTWLALGVLVMKQMINLKV